MHVHPLEIIAVLVLCGLLRPFDWRPWAIGYSALWRPGEVKPRSDASPDPDAADPVSLNAIELGLVAEFSLEMARANEAVAEDATQGVEARRRASRAATAWRQRAEVFHSYARRQSALPVLPGADPVLLGTESIHVPEQAYAGATGQAYAGPERRRQMRRTQTRRTGPAPSAGDDCERRAGAERRRCDRRRPELAPR